MQTRTDPTPGKAETGCTAPHPVVSFLFFAVTLAAVVLLVALLL